MEKINVALFDMGRVLVKIDFDAFPNALGLGTQELRQPYQQAAMKLEVLYECGKISTAEFLDSLYELFQSKFSKDRLIDAYNAIIVEENTAILPLVKEIREQYRIAVLSNTSEEHWKKSLECAPMLHMFPQKFTSFEIGAMKPASIVYDTVIRHLAVEPSSVLFIDDVKENIDGAKACGMQGIVFSSVEQLRTDLRTRGIV